MGYYVNLPDIAEFIDQNSVRITQSDAERFFNAAYDFYDPSKVVICAVDNYVFFAYAIAYSAEEFKAFSQPSDSRPKYWFLIDKNVLINSGGIDQYTIEMLRDMGE